MKSRINWVHFKENRSKFCVLSCTLLWQCTTWAQLGPTVILGSLSFSYSEILVVFFRD